MPSTLWDTELIRHSFVSKKFLKGWHGLRGSKTVYSILYFLMLLAPGCLPTNIPYLWLPLTRQQTLFLHVPSNWRLTRSQAVGLSHKLTHKTLSIPPTYIAICSIRNEKAEYWQGGQLPKITLPVGSRAGAKRRDPPAPKAQHHWPIVHGLFSSGCVCWRTAATRHVFLRWRLLTEWVSGPDSEVYNFGPDMPLSCPKA